MTPFVTIFGHGRSGTSTLRQIYNCNQGFNLLGEPFNPSFNNWSPNLPRFSELVTNIGVQQCVAAMRAVPCHGMKHLKHQLSAADNLWLLTQPDHRVVFVWRRNLLQTAVSISLAKATSIWARDDVADISAAYRRLPPLNTAEILDSMERIGGQVEWYRKSLKFWRVPHFELVYEDFYVHHDEAKKLDTLREMFRFTGTDASKCDWGRVKELLATNKLNDHTHHLIPNFQEVANLGSAARGFLTVPYT